MSCGKHKLHVSTNWVCHRVTQCVTGHHTDWELCTTIFTEHHGGWKVTLVIVTRVTLTYSTLKFMMPSASLLVIISIAFKKR